MTFYIERFIPKLVPAKDTLRVRRRGTPSFDTPVVTGLGEGALVRRSLYTRSLTGLLKFGPGARTSSIPMFLAPGKKIERIRINLSHLGLVPGLCQGSRAFPARAPC